MNKLFYIWFQNDIVVFTYIFIIMYIRTNTKNIYSWCLFLGSFLLLYEYLGYNCKKSDNQVLFSIKQLAKKFIKHKAIESILCIIILYMNLFKNYGKLLN